MFLWGLIFTEDFGKINFIPMQICNQETEQYSKGYKIQKTNIRWASLFPRTNRCKCCDSAPRPDSWGQSFDQSWPHWRCRCGKGAWQTRDMAAFIERGWYCLFIYLFIVYFSVVSRVELPQSFVWQKWRHCECSAWDAGVQDYCPTGRGHQAHKDGHSLCQGSFGQMQGRFSYKRRRDGKC